MGSDAGRIHLPSNMNLQDSFKFANNDNKQQPVFIEGEKLARTPPKQHSPAKLQPQILQPPSIPPEESLAGLLA